MEVQRKLPTRETALFQSRHGLGAELSADDILAVSERVSRDFTPHYTSHLLAKKVQIRLTAQEMQSISEEISREFMVRPSPRLPKAEIVLMPVDPDHLHAYWHLDEEAEPREALPLTLRIYSMPDSQAVASDKPGWFDMPIEKGVVQYKVTVPAIMTGNYYSAAIGWRPNENQFTAFANSDTTFIPRTHFSEPATTNSRLGRTESEGEPDKRRIFPKSNASGRGKHDR